MKKRRALIIRRAPKAVPTEPFEMLFGRLDVANDASMEARLLRFQNIVMTASEMGIVIPRFMDLARQVNLVLRCEATLKGIRKEGGDGRADHGSAVRQYAAQFETTSGFGERGDDTGPAAYLGDDSGDDADTDESDASDEA